MSIRLMGAVWGRTDLSTTQKLIMLAICDMANDEGYCWPSMALIEEKCSLSNSCVRENITGLVRNGFLRKEQRQRSDGSYSSNLYHIGPAITDRPANTPTPRQERGTPRPADRHEPSREPYRLLNTVSSCSDGDPTGHCYAQVNHIPPSQTSETGTVAPTRRAARELAVSIYDLYPRKVGREKAVQAILRAFLKVDPEMLKSKVEEYAAAVTKWPRDRRQFIPHPTTWFNQGRWDDDPAEWEHREEQRKKSWLERVTEGLE